MSVPDPEDAAVGLDLEWLVARRRGLGGPAERLDVAIAGDADIRIAGEADAAADQELEGQDRVVVGGATSPSSKVEVAVMR
jgi:hypothetical protein